jgi:hypothetical protein
MKEKAITMIAMPTSVVVFMPISIFLLPLLPDNCQRNFSDWRRSHTSAQPALQQQASQKEAYSTNYQSRSYLNYLIKLEIVNRYF